MLEEGQGAEVSRCAFMAARFRMAHKETSGDFLPKLVVRRCLHEAVSLFESFEWRFFERGGDEGEEKKKFGSSDSEFL